MSEAHIPQPNTQAAAPAEAFDSTAAAPHGQTVAGIGAPAGPPQEITPHTGASNTFDITIHRQFIPTDTITWSVNQTKGTLLWYKPIHPTFSNPIISYLMGLYNTWGGGFDYNFKVAGTGFHAGAVAIVRLPPNKDPTQFTTPSSWGPFEYVVFDPKMLEVASLSVIDQRPIMYHYMPYDKDAPSSFGGWIAMYVLIPLNTSATGSQQIAIQAFVRPGPTFTPSQLISPSNNVNPGGDLTPDFLSAFDFNVDDHLANGYVQGTYLQVQPLSERTTQMVLNCSRVNGTQLDPFSKGFHPQEFYEARPIQLGATVSVADPIKMIYSLPLSQMTPVDSSRVVIQREQPLNADQYTSASWTGAWDTLNNVYTLSPSTQPSFTPVVGDKINLTYSQFTAITHPTIPSYGPVLSEESLLLFASEVPGAPQTTLKCIQTYRIAQFFKTARLDNYLYGGACVLFIIYDKIEDFGVGYAKLYQEGFLSTRGRVDELNFDLSRIKLVYDSLILRSDPIPVNPTFNLNRLLVEKRSSSPRASLQPGFNQKKIEWQQRQQQH